MSKSTTPNTNPHMQVAVLQENLAKALSTVAPAVLGSSATLPVLQHVLLATDAGRLKVTACNLNQAITVHIGAKVETDGAITLPFKTLNDLISSLLPDKVDIGVPGASPTVKIGCGKTAANIKGFDAQEFPIVSAFDAGKPVIVEMPINALRRAIHLVAFAAAVDESRPMLTGVQIAISGQCMTLSATDGFRLSQVAVDLKDPVSEPAKFLVPAKTLAMLARVLPTDDDATVCIQAAKSGVLLFAAPNVCMTTQLLDQKFPEVEHIIPRKHTTRAVANRADMLKACKQANVFARESLDQVRLSVEVGQDGDPGLISVSARADETGDGHAELEAQTTGEDVEIAFNVRFLQDVVNAADAPQLALELTESRRAGVIKMVGDDNFLHVIMPMNLPK